MNMLPTEEGTFQNGWRATPLLLVILTCTALEYMREKLWRITVTRGNLNRFLIPVVQAFDSLVNAYYWQNLLKRCSSVVIDPTSARRFTQHSKCGRDTVHVVIFPIVSSAPETVSSLEILPLSGRTPRWCPGIMWLSPTRFNTNRCEVTIFLSQTRLGTKHCGRSDKRRPRTRHVPAW